MNTPATPPHLHVHGDSLRVGIRLAGNMYTGAIPPDDVVKRVISTKPVHVIVNEFSLDILTTATRERIEHRRVTAMRAMEILLHHCGEAEHLTDRTLEHIAAKAWKMAMYMDTQETVSVLMDSLDDSDKKKQA